jgi:hypothetical protein
VLGVFYAWRALRVLELVDDGDAERPCIPSMGVQMDTRPSNLFYVEHPHPSEDRPKRQLTDGPQPRSHPAELH